MLSIKYLNTHHISCEAVRINVGLKNSSPRCESWTKNWNVKHKFTRDHHEKLCFTFRILFVGPLLLSCSRIFFLTTVNFRVYLHFIQRKPTKINNTSFILINTDTNNATANATYSIWNHFQIYSFFLTLTLFLLFLLSAVLSFSLQTPPPSLTLLFFSQSLTPFSLLSPPSIISDFLFAVLSTLRNPPRTRILSAKPEMIEWNNRW